MKKQLDRRTVLRGMLGGAAIRIALPPLEAMLNNHGTAWASGAPLGKRFGVWWWAGGVGATYKHPRWDVEGLWVPQGEGRNWTPSRLLQPLAQVKDYVTVVSGMDLPLAGPDSVHHAHRAAALSATYMLDHADLYQPRFGGVLAPSIDQIIADGWQAKGLETHLPSIQIGISKAGPFVNTTSFKGPKQRLPSESNPRAVFDRLFSSPLSSGGGEPSASIDAALKAQKSVLDVVKADTQALAAQLGATDKRRLDAHLEGLRGVERQLMPSMGAAVDCMKPANPPAMGSGENSREDLEGLHKIMSDLLVTALACDLTRVFSVEFTPMQAYTVYWQVNSTTAHHDLTHETGEQAREELRKTILFNMQQLAYLLTAMKATPVGSGNLLDQVAIYATTEGCDQSMHSTKDHPILLIGKGGGSLNAGLNHRAPTGDNTAKVLLTLCHAMGLALPEIGKGLGRTAQVVPALLA